MKTTDITGKRFHHLTAVLRAGSRRSGGSMRVFWLYRCDCGKERIAAKSDVRADESSKIISCGCIKREPNTLPHRTQFFGTLDAELAADCRSNRAAVPPSMRNLPSRIVKARHACGSSFGVGTSTGGVSSLMMEG